LLHAGAQMPRMWRQPKTDARYVYTVILYNPSDQAKCWHKEHIQR
jgi:hypothetical protein